MEMFTVDCKTWNVEWNGTWNGMWNGTWNGTWNRMTRDLPRERIVRQKLGVEAWERGYTYI